MHKYTIVGDIHARPDNLDKVQKLFELVEDLGNPVIVLGDIFDTKEIIRGKVLNKLLKLFSSSRLHWDLLVGNHDMFNLDNAEEGHALTALEMSGNLIFVTDKPIINYVDKMLRVPFSKDANFLREALKDAKTNQVKYVFGHFDIATFDYGNGHISDHGLTVDDFKGFQKVISGHYHAFQELGNIVYLGTPFSHNFGESNQRKFIAEFDTTTGALELIETTEIFPRHITLTCDMTTDTFDVSSVRIEDNHVRILAKGTAEQLEKLPRIEGVKYVDEVVEGSIESETINESDSKEDQFVKWAKDVAKLEKETIALGLEVLKDV